MKLDIGNKTKQTNIKKTNWHFIVWPTSHLSTFGAQALFPSGMTSGASSWRSHCDGHTQTWAESPGCLSGADVQRESSSCRWREIFISYGQNLAFWFGHLTLAVRDTPQGAGQSGCIMEATPGFLTLGDMGGLVVSFSLHSGAKIWLRFCENKSLKRKSICGWVTAGLSNHDLAFILYQNQVKSLYCHCTEYNKMWVQENLDKVVKMQMYIHLRLFLNYLNCSYD